MSTVLQFVHFNTPHTGDALCELLFDVIIEWKLRKDIDLITTNNKKDIMNRV